MLNPMIADLDRLYELMDSTHQGSSQLIRDLREELKTEIDKKESEKEVDTVEYWKRKALRLEKSLEESRESRLRLVESLKTMETLKTGECFLSFILENSPFIMGHQDQDLRYMFIFNQFPSLKEEDILGKTDSEIFNGNGVKEFEEFKREVLEKGKASKREITFDTDLFGSKTFMIFVETVYSKTGKKVGINYIGMEVTDQVRKREKMAKLGEDNAVRKAMESELGKTIHITEEMMNAKKILAKMSGELRSPLLGIVSMADRFSSITKLDEEQRRLLIEMISSAGLALERINEFLDLSEVVSGRKKHSFQNIFVFFIFEVLFIHYLIKVSK
ncbi:histidine kinase 5 [Brassica rapa]|uniref:histidine kinase n=2 Tax=Brassica TaxID=3705 RepID=M4D2J8_BRACM|nr:histidine kinase 5 [Brassica rapa]XP_048593825.1 histidine kinase 5 isoform X1 [Brassica napus]